MLKKRFSCISSVIQHYQAQPRTRKKQGNFDLIEDIEQASLRLRHRAIDQSFSFSIIDDKQKVRLTNKAAKSVLDPLTEFSSG